MKTGILVVCALALTACGGGNDTGAEGSSKPVSVVGSWSFPYPGMDCSGTYNFAADHEFNATSNNEELIGTYSFSDQANDSGRYFLRWEIDSDNKQVNCEGDNDDFRGKAFEVYLDFPAEDTMNWYIEAAGDAAVVTLTKG